MRPYVLIIIVFLGALAALALPSEPLFIAPLYVEYSSSSAAEFANEVKELRQRIGESPRVQVGFSAFLNVRFNQPTLNSPIDRLDHATDAGGVGLDHQSSALQPFAGSYRNRFRILSWSERSARRSNPKPTFEMLSGSRMDRSPILTKPFAAGEFRRPRGSRRRDMRNRCGDGFKKACRFLETGWLRQCNKVLKRFSTSAAIRKWSFRSRAISTRKDGEGPAVRSLRRTTVRSWWPNSAIGCARTVMPATLRRTTDDDHDGHTFNKDFRQQFRTWRLRYFDESGPIPYDQYRAMTEKLPQSGPYFIDGGFDAPRSADEPSNPLWKAWQEFRVRVITNYVRDFAEWITADSEFRHRVSTRTRSLRIIYSAARTRPGLQHRQARSKPLSFPALALRRDRLRYIQRKDTLEDFERGDVQAPATSGRATGEFLNTARRSPRSTMKITILNELRTLVFLPSMRSLFRSHGRMLICTSCIESKTPRMNALFENLFKKSGSDIHRRAIALKTTSGAAAHAAKTTDKKYSQNRKNIFFKK